MTTQTEATQLRRSAKRRALLAIATLLSGDSEAADAIWADARAVAVRALVAQAYANGLVVGRRQAREGRS
jgi:hypothetical protein